MDPLRKLLKESRGFVFDFDGTLVDSNAIKQQGFKACFFEFPGRLEEILAYCRGHNHTPRWDKFRHVYEQILGFAYTPEIEQQLSRRFEQATTLQITQAPEIPFAEEFLRRVCKIYWTGLLSATPGPILEEILKGRGWKGFFQRIQGAPVRKSAWLRELKGQMGWKPGELLFFGDTPEDVQAARDAECGFIAVGDALASRSLSARVTSYEPLLKELET